MVPNNPHFSARFMEREKHKVSYHSVDAALWFCSSSRLGQKISEPNSEPLSVVSLISLNALSWVFFCCYFLNLPASYLFFPLDLPFSSGLGKKACLQSSSIHKLGWFWEGGSAFPSVITVLWLSLEVLMQIKWKTVQHECYGFSCCPAYGPNR